MMPQNIYNNFLNGERIYLREVRIEDVDGEYYNWLNDPEITQFLETRFTPQSREQMKEYVRNMDGKANEIFLAICLKQNGEHIGNIKLGPINTIHKFADISLLIGNRSCWGKGFATEAIGLIKAYGFGVLGLNRLAAGAYEQNTGSIRAFEKNGFSIEGQLKSHFFSQGKYVDRILMGIVNN